MKPREPRERIELSRLEFSLDLRQATEGARTFLDGSFPDLRELDVDVRSCGIAAGDLERTLAGETAPRLERLGVWWAQPEATLALLNALASSTLLRSRRELSFGGPKVPSNSYASRYKGAFDLLEEEARIHVRVGNYRSADGERRNVGACTVGLNDGPLFLEV
jgi:hypothetical protein